MGKVLKITVAKFNHRTKVYRRVGRFDKCKLIVEHFKAEHGRIDGREYPNSIASTESA